MIIKTLQLNLCEQLFLGQGEFSITSKKLLSSFYKAPSGRRRSCAFIRWDTVHMMLRTMHFAERLEKNTELWKGNPQFTAPQLNTCTPRTKR